MFKLSMSKTAIAVAMSLGAIGSVQAQTAAPQASDGLSLYIVQFCKPLAEGGRCELSLVQTRASDPPPQNVQTSCAPGWVVHFMAERGTVEQGGVNRGASIVCGYEQANAALRAAIQTCDEQAMGICSGANQIDVQWAQWTPVSPAVQHLGLNRPIAINRLPQSQSCRSGIPVQESDRCTPVAAVTLRSAGVR